MKRVLLIIFVMAFVVAGLVKLGSAYSDKPGDLRKAPDFTFSDLKGEKHTLGSLRGKVVIVDLWATWCPPCKKEIPNYINLQKKHSNKLFIIGVSYDETPDELKEFLSKHEIGRQINYPIVFGPSQPTYFGDPNTLPQAFIIDKKGNIRVEHIGLFPPEELNATLEKLLAEPE
jgi:thiol-disulfide isomerase/thioredoxin